MVDGLWKLLIIIAVRVPPPLPCKTKRRLSTSASNGVPELGIPVRADMTVGWKTNVATLDDLLNLTLTLLSILIFFFLLTLLLGPLVGKSQVRRRSRCTLLTYTATCCEMATCPLPRQLALFLSGSCCTALCGFFWRCPILTPCLPLCPLRIKYAAQDRANWGGPNRQKEEGKKL